MEEESEKAGLKLNIQKTKVTVSGPITSWQIDGKTVETDFIFLGSKITADGDCSHEIKKMFAPWKKSYDKPRQHIKKQRHHFADKFLYNQSYDFSSSHVWMWVAVVSIAQSCLTLCNPMDCSPPGSSVHGIFQARILEYDY